MYLRLIFGDIRPLQSPDLCKSICTVPLNVRAIKQYKQSLNGLNLLANPLLQRPRPSDQATVPRLADSPKLLATASAKLPVPRARSRPRGRHIVLYIRSHNMNLEASLTGGIGSVRETPELSLSNSRVWAIAALNPQTRLQENGKLPPNAQGR